MTMISRPNTDFPKLQWLHCTLCFDIDCHWKIAWNCVFYFFSASSLVVVCGKWINGGEIRIFPVKLLTRPPVGQLDPSPNRLFRVDSCVCGPTPSLWNRVVSGEVSDPWTVAVHWNHVGFLVKRMPWLIFTVHLEPLTHVSPYMSP